MSNERQGMKDVRPGLYVTQGEDANGQNLWRVVVVLRVADGVVTYREGLDPDAEGQVRVTQWIGSMKTGTIRAIAMSNDTERDSSADADVEGVLFRAAAEAAAAQDMGELHHVAEAVVMWRRDGLSPEFCSRLAYLAKNRMTPGHLTHTDPLACITVRRTWPTEEVIDERDGLMACMRGEELGCECPRCNPKQCACEGCSRIVEVPEFPGDDTPEMCAQCNEGTPNDPARDRDNETASRPAT